MQKRTRLARINTGATLGYCSACTAFNDGRGFSLGVGLISLLGGLRAWRKRSRGDFSQVSVPLRQDSAFLASPEGAAAAYLEICLTLPWPIRWEDELVGAEIFPAPSALLGSGFGLLDSCLLSWRHGVVE